ncbi:MAG: serine hydrolase [Atopobiaceae bacterium]|jgi:D-alanyl-D-alanine carboxypeptidase (penicillin-binding protein 5/6)|nr:serine hydrolase [Atopobiaceae bacterium]MCH4179994.1 serine hydrolase [Atopobiaceae bacterium]MCH4213954.1 serine hydrolase [Atopobiaceae bacterium]MCH4230180.1 serine hydrolase [Atopobiaceae bacterium]MCH4275583.1 serine hydrolase [Atopobiaceae bacterium]
MDASSPIRHDRAFGSVIVASLVALALAFVVSPSSAQAAESSPTLSEAQGAIVVDGSGNELWGVNEDVEYPMASITKIMTAMVAIDSGYSFSSTVTLSDVTLSENAQVAGYKGGETSSFEDLMRVMLVYSANDAAVEVARAVAGSEDAFVERMNEKAAQLGLTHTHFENVHGLDADGHYSSVSDLVKMGRYAMLNYPFIRKMVSTRSVTVPVGDSQLTFDSTDDLMETYQGLLGIKTGSCEGGTTFLGCSSRDGVTLYTAVLGCSTTQGRFDDTATMMDWAYDTYVTYHLADPDQSKRYVPYAYRFGWYCVLSADAKVDGLVWPYGGDTTYTTITTGGGKLAVPDQTYSVTLYQQDGRVVAACSSSTGSGLVKGTSFDSSLPWLSVAA